MSAVPWASVDSKHSPGNAYILYDDYMLRKVTLGVLKGASKLNVLLLLLLSWIVIPGLGIIYYPC